MKTRKFVFCLTLVCMITLTGVMLPACGSSKKTITLGPGGSFLSLMFPSRSDADAAWKACKGIKGVGAGWLGGTTVNLYLFSSDQGLKDQVLAAAGKPEVLIDAIAGPAVVSDTQKSTLFTSGGVMVIMEKDVPADQVGSSVDEAELKVLKDRLANIEGASYWLQALGFNRYLVLVEGGVNVQSLLATLKQTGRTSIVDLGEQLVPEGTIIQTDLDSLPGEGPVYKTILTWKDFTGVKVTRDELGNYSLLISVLPDAQQRFGDYTRDNIGKYAAFVLDNRILSSPRVASEVRGDITVQLPVTLEEAKSYAFYIQNGALPEPLKITQSSAISGVVIINN
jgi:preprotein translocase subunit SecD